MEAFRYPLARAPRTAVLVPWFKTSRFCLDAIVHAQYRVFRDGWSEKAADFAPAAVAATYDQLRELDRADLPSLTHALVVLWRPGQARLTAEDRDRLWRTFRVPVFEQVIGKSGELLAGECEAHDGLHLESPRLPIDHEYVDASLCPCGRKTPRIGGAQGAALLRRVAAYAR